MATNGPHQELTKPKHECDACHSRPYRLGVALSGGGARGFAHAGALMAIEEAGLRPDVVAGVSAGAVIAVLYAGGVTPLRMADIFARTGFFDFAELSMGEGGLFKIEKFRNFILRVLGGKSNLEDLRIPVYLGATDIDNGRPAVFDSGEIGSRMIASCSIPIVFKPVNIDGVNYVDGGVLRNHPAWIIRDKCDTLIGVNVSPLMPVKDCRSIAGMAMRTYRLMTKANQAEDMALCDVSVVTPEIADCSVFNLKNIKRIFVSGYVQTRKALIGAGLWHPDNK
ncbi:MAG: patatin-like phospholipase family protein [Muribaculaceae bacterium]|nr:patatin-like phospholipase family protein [Muribaculaceae bacterium]MDE6526330.1 patatin-like phospholipase family protein [Muribaculaceae bacterium]MDE6611725.1 patatin-like phospholipase family protein [Muribaculaceae bacterium]